MMTSGTQVGTAALGCPAEQSSVMVSPPPALPMFKMLLEPQSE